MKQFVAAPLAALVLVTSTGVAAQVAQDPSSPSVAVPAFSYRSAFDGYRPMNTDKGSSWRQANEEMGSLRGHIDQIKPVPGANQAAPSPNGRREPVDQPRSTQPEDTRSSPGHAH